MYDWGVERIQNELRRRLIVINTAEKAALVFVDKDNKITVESLLNGLRAIIMKVVNVIVLIFVIASLLLIGIYILFTMNAAKKAKNEEVALPAVKYDE